MKTNSHVDRISQDQFLVILKKMHQAKRFLRTLSVENKNKILLNLVEKLNQMRPEILEANQNDVKNYRQMSHYQKSIEDRLILNPARLDSMNTSLLKVASFPDPVGEVHSEGLLSNGLKIRQVRSPLGLIMMIFESRPNVITEAFSLALKAGNGCLFKGGKESIFTSKVIYHCITESIREAQVEDSIFLGLENPSREITDFLIKQNQYIDVLIPRGGDKLIEHVTLHSTIPLIKNDRGLCHLYIQEEANLNMALNVLINAKTQRPSVCNSVETLLIDQKIAEHFLPQMYKNLVNLGVEFYVCPITYQMLMPIKLKGQDSVESERKGEPLKLADSASYNREYLDLKLNVKVVQDWKEAIEHIEFHGSRHSEAIITENEIVAKQFENQVDAAVVYWNASTRFTDGGELGMGGEIGISTQKLHVRGPVGLQALTSLRWIVEGHGQTRS